MESSDFSHEMCSTPLEKRGCERCFLFQNETSVVLNKSNKKNRDDIISFWLIDSHLFVSFPPLMIIHPFISWALHSSRRYKNKRSKRTFFSGINDFEIYAKQERIDVEIQNWLLEFFFWSDERRNSSHSSYPIRSFYQKNRRRKRETKRNNWMQMRKREIFWEESFFPICPIISISFDVFKSRRTGRNKKDDRMKRWIERPSVNLDIQKWTDSTQILLLEMEWSSSVQVRTENRGREKLTERDEHQPNPWILFSFFSSMTLINGCQVMDEWWLCPFLLFFSSLHNSCYSHLIQNRTIRRTEPFSEEKKTTSGQKSRGEII